MNDWFRHAPIWLLGLMLFFVTVVCALAGARLSRWAEGRASRLGDLTEAQQGYVVSTVYALLGLLVAFTFGVAVERYQLRRELVIDDANAIHSVYLKAQLLGEPDRSRFSNLLVRLAENHLQLAQLRNDRGQAARFIQADDELLRELWSDTVPAFQSIRNLDFSSSFVDSVNEIIVTDAKRKAVRRGEIPTTILVLLIFYSLVAAALLGGVMKSRKGEIVSVGLLALNVLALMLIADINRPVEGTIHESQEPMERMLKTLKANPPAVYQRLANQPA